MNRVYDERLELQLQEYEFAELDTLLPGSMQAGSQPEPEDADSAMLEIVNRH